MMRALGVFAPRTTDVLGFPPPLRGRDSKACRKLRALTHDDAQFAKEWSKDIAQTVVELEDGRATVVLNDEAKG